MDYNPYDFANPVADPDLLVGRSAEVSDIEYYSKQAVAGRRPINLVLLGERASGKTSLLNIIEQKTRSAGMLAVRLDLDEGDVESPLLFFGKLYDSLVTECCDVGAYAGVGGKTYEVFRECLDTYSVPEEPTFAPLIFPTQYARSAGAGNLTGPVTDTIVRRDLARLHEEVARPIALLMDECDVLSKNHVLLQKIRNIFMNLDSYFLVMSGSNSFIPAMDEVFSPIVRQYKRIHLEPFAELEDTHKCISEPLTKASIDPDDVLPEDSYLLTEEVHELSGGRPYEIQLICHFMFKRVQEGKAQEMGLTLDVLDSVLAELVSDRSPEDRAVVGLCRRLTTQDLKDLALLLVADGDANVADLAFAHGVFGEAGTYELLLGRLGSAFERLSSVGVLEDRDNRVSFAGDDFERIYLKYYARSQAVPFTSFRMPFEALVGNRVARSLRKAVPDAGSLEAIARTSPSISRYIAELAESFADPDVLGLVPREGPVPEARSLYAAIFEASYVEQALGLVRCEVTAPNGTKSGRWFSILWTEFEESGLSRWADEQGMAIAELGGQFEFQVLQLCAISQVRLLEAAQAAVPALRRAFADWHGSRLYEVYADMDLDGSFRHARLAWTLGDDFDHANNYGYLMLAHGLAEDVSALDVFLSAEGRAERPMQHSLAAYNRAMAHYFAGDRDLSVEALEAASQLLPEIPDYDLLMFRLLAPGEEGTLVELVDPRLDDAIASSLDYVRSGSS